MENIFEHNGNYYKYKDVIEISRIRTSITRYEPSRNFNWRQFKFDGEYTVRRYGKFRYVIWVGSPIGERLVVDHEFDYTVVIGSEEDKIIQVPTEYVDKYNKTLIEWDKSLNKKNEYDNS